MTTNVASNASADKPCATSVRPIRIGILGHVGNENLGDEAIIAAVIQNLRQYWPSAVILGFTGNPVDTQVRHGIESFPIRRDSGPRQSSQPPTTAAVPESRRAAPSPAKSIKSLVDKIPVVSALARAAFRALEKIPELAKEVKFLFDSRKAVKGLDLLIFAGSHQLNDYVAGPWSFPYTVYKWAALADNAGAKVVFLSMGAGPIDTRLGRWFIRHALRIASYRSYRDTTGKQVIDTIQAFDSDRVIPDLAFSLDPTVKRGERSPTDRLIVGLNPLPLYAGAYWYRSDPDKYNAYIDKLATFSSWMVDHGCEVKFIPTQLRVDPGVIEDVIERMSKSSSAENARFVSQPVIHELDDLLEEIANLDIMVATRYHGIVLSLVLQVPVFSVAYHRKSQDIVHWLNLEITRLTPNALKLMNGPRDSHYWRRTENRLKNRFVRKSPNFVHRFGLSTMRSSASLRNQLEHPSGTDRRRCFPPI